MSDTLAVCRPEPTREVKISMRAQKRQLDVIDHAAEVLGKNRTSFMLETAVREAEMVLLDKRLFVVDDATYDRFMERLDASPARNPKLRALLKRQAPWET